MDEPQAYLNGQWIPASAAAVSVGDAGFILGATVAEQVRTFVGETFRLHDHLGRMRQSLDIVGIDPEMSTDEMVRIARELVARNHRLLADGDDLGLSIFVTPGIYPSYAAVPPAGSTVCLHTYPLPFQLWAEKYRTGQSLVTTDVEQVSDRSWPAGLKCRSRMHYFLADRRAADIEAGARALLLDGQGFVTETSTANVLIFRKAEGLISPPAEKILRGISRAVAIELADRLGIDFVQRDLTPEDVAAADEVLLVSTPLCLLPVTRFNGASIADGRPGDVFHRLLAAWSDLAGLDIAEQAERFARR
ncbi:MAG: aminotransferase class IV [Candidatus Nealsonbacteria bacterium]|nr:aminotransferase class IV [Candidatus Nealsonbacteria bacterium]